MVGLSWVHLPIDEEHDGYRRGEKCRQHAQPAQVTVLGVRPPAHVLGEHGRDGDPYGESHGMEVRCVIVSEMVNSARRKGREGLYCGCSRTREAPSGRARP